MVWMGCPSSDQSASDAGLGPQDAAHGSDAGWQADTSFADASFDAGTPEAGVPELCIDHIACGSLHRCYDGRCIARVEAENGIQFERYHVAAIDAHRSKLPRLGPAIGVEYSSVIGNLGFGGALFDVDGDQDLDLFLATQGFGALGVSPACIYENRSLPTKPEFVAMPEHCGDRDEMPHSGFGLDLEGDGFHELLLTGTTLMEVHRFHPERSVIADGRWTRELQSGRCGEHGFQLGRPGRHHARLPARSSATASQRHFSFGVPSERRGRLSPA